MHQYNVGASFERIAIDIAGPFPESDRRNTYILIFMGYFTKWPDVYAIPNQEVLTVPFVLVTTFFCRFGVPMKIHSDQGRDFQSRLMQEVLERLELERSYARSQVEKPRQDDRGAPDEGGLYSETELG